MKNDSLYSIINGKVYFREHYLLRGVDIKTFEVLGGYWARDQKSIYCTSTKIRNVDVSKFRLLNELFASDGKFIFYLSGIAKKVRHPQSFAVIGDVFKYEPWGGAGNGYAKDQELVYFYHETVGAPRPLKGADPNTFQVLQYGYAKDEKNVYACGEPIVNALPPSFKPLSPLFSKDADNVYFHLQAIPSADPNTFQTLDDLCYGKDQLNAYYGTRKVRDAELEHFRVVDPDFGFAVDRSHVFFDGVQQPDFLAAGFHHIGSGYYTDGKTYSFQNDRLPVPDSQSFIVVASLQEDDRLSLGPVGQFAAFDRYHVFQGPSTKSLPEVSRDFSCDAPALIQAFFLKKGQE